MLDFKKRKSEKLHDEAEELYQSGGDEDKIISMYLQALQLNEKRAATHYNLGLVYKYRGEWDKSLSYNKRAHELNPMDESAIWNWGIAATALENWNEARIAWKKYGINIIDGNGEVIVDYGLNPVRLYNDNEDGEVVWGNRIDPARIQIENIPLPKSGYRYQDIVLNDGAPNGYRISDGNEYPVFDMLELLSRSDFNTFTMKLRLNNAENIEDITEKAEKKDIKIEDWTTHIQDICTECSEGTVDQDKVSAVADLLERDVGIAAIDEREVKEFIDCLKEYKEIEILSFEKSL